MTEATATGHLSIGEVLSLVQEDFPDVTISKIRFLESQGLIAPERTGSGYRKFYDADIERLRWILRQQRDHFLPLKVIKKMLDDGVDLNDAVETQPTLWSSSEGDDADGGSAASGDDDDGTATGTGTTPTDEDDARSSYRSPKHPAVASARPTARVRPDAPAERRRASAANTTKDTTQDRTPDAAPAPVARSTDTTPTSSDVPAGPVDVVAEGRERAREAGIVVETHNDEHPADDPAPERGHSAASPERPAHSTPADVVAALQEDPRSARRGRKAAARAEEPVDEETTPVAENESPGPSPSRSKVSAPTPPLTSLLSAEELCELCSISAELLAGLEQFGLVVPASLGGRSAYDAEAVDVARIASRYAELGVEPRHLRMYKISAEREAGFVEQLVVPLIKQRNPAARQQAVERCDELIAMGAELHSALLRRQLGRILGT
jgi:DNA-binding transcriptional MerR regulator